MTPNTMSTEKHTHTPGPWQVEQNNPARDTFIGPVMGGARIAEVMFQPFGGEFSHTLAQGRKMANARLIAASPDLLSNLQYVESVAPTDTPEDTDCVSITITGKALKDIRAALAKVRGEEGPTMGEEIATRRAHNWNRRGRQG